jgi:hypothetical protein
MEQRISGNASTESGDSFPNDIVASDCTGKKTNIYLPVDFNLTENDVYCGRGAENEGNQHFRRIIVDNLKSYYNAKTRLEKTSIISQIIHQVQLKCKESGTGLGFIGKDHITQRYYEVEHSKAVSSISPLP